MRLINCETKEIEEFATNIPPYAILSHTWGDEELTFAEMVRDREMLMSDDSLSCGQTKKKGWHKIDWACKQTMLDTTSGYRKLRYVWVDTVCIDKTSSAELSEAINSMYRWYKEAVVCFAYLTDVPEVDFENSRWFTRGWTLQELIAPHTVKFYASDGRYLAEKEDIVSKLESITGINASALEGSPMAHFSVACIMSWASRRKTSRPEDQAYSLLGLFGLNMPLLYGEGSKAFYRLQLAIYEDRDDQSIFAWENDWTVTSLFAPDPRYFRNAKYMTPLTRPALKCRPPELVRRRLTFHSCLELELGGRPQSVIVLNCHDASIVDASRPPSLIAISIRRPPNDSQGPYTRGIEPMFSLLRVGNKEFCTIGDDNSAEIWPYGELIHGLIRVYVKVALPKMKPVTVLATSHEPPINLKNQINVRYSPIWPEGFTHYLDNEITERLNEPSERFYAERLVYRRDAATGDVEGFLVVYYFSSQDKIAVRAFSNLEDLLDCKARRIPDSEKSKSSIDYKHNGLHLSIRLTPSNGLHSPTLDMFSSRWDGPDSYTRGEDSPFEVFQ